MVNQRLLEIIADFNFWQKKQDKCNNLLIITENFESKEKIKGKIIKYLPLWKWLLQEKTCSIKNNF